MEILTADDPKAWFLRRFGIKIQEKIHDHVIPEIKREGWLGAIGQLGVNFIPVVTWVNEDPGVK